MDNQNARQQAFLTLRPPCVELSATALKFRGKQTPIKTVLHALQDLLKVLRTLGEEEALDAKLAEYAFFPFSHIFNESQRLSSTCLEIAVQSVQILVAKGWRQNINPTMGKQLLILMTLLAGGSPGQTQTESPSDDLKVASFDCIEVLIDWMTTSSTQRLLFDEAGIKNVVDQLTYLLLEAITDNPSELVQLAAARALCRLTERIRSRILLASLLPRTVSALTKALRTSTQVRRTHKVLALDLSLLNQNLRDVLSDTLVFQKKSETSTPEKSTENVADESEILDESWLKATSAQIKIALTHVTKLRSYDRQDVREALLQLCLMVIEECPRSLAESIPVMVETIVVLANDQSSSTAKSALKHLVTSNPSISDSLKSSLYTWCISLPRLMQGSDDRPKQRILGQVSTTFEILADTANTSEILTNSMASTLVDSVSAAVQLAKIKPAAAIMEAPVRSLQAMAIQDKENRGLFQTVLLDHRSQEGSLNALLDLIKNLRAMDISNNFTRTIVDRIPTGDTPTQLSSIWLALNMLRQDKNEFMINDLIMDSAMSTNLRQSHPYLVSDLYSFTLPFLLNDRASVTDSETDWRLQALALECLVLQADQLGRSYRPELIDTLYPVLSLMGTANPNLQAHAMTALDLMATACEYSSTKDLLVENVDYLVNSIAIKLNSLDLSPQAPQVLVMMVRLCGASLLPYLDDLIGSIFAALDDYHGYPELVELLFEVLKTIVDESAKNPLLAITDGKAPEHRKVPYRPSTVDDILADLAAAKSRKRKRTRIEEQEEAGSAPRRSWSAALDGLDQENAPSTTAEDEELAENDEESALPAPSSGGEEEKKKTPSKAHQLLLNISQATTPHLASPSPRVRLTLLQLLERVIPLLAQDEDSFLPLVNRLWPGLVERLFMSPVLGEREAEGEAAYNVCASAETMASLCEGAGDFMAGRIEGVLERLVRLWTRVSVRGAGLKEKESRGRVGGSPVELRLVKTEGQVGGPVKNPASSLVVLNSHSADAQIREALVRLMVAILLHVRVSEETGEVLSGLLAPLLDQPGREGVVGALEAWNADAVWVVREGRGGGGG